MNDYIKGSDAAKRWGISSRRVAILCKQGRIEGAFKFGNSWAIPENAEKPEDQRVKTGKYRDWRKKYKDSELS